MSSVFNKTTNALTKIELAAAGLIFSALVLLTLLNLIIRNFLHTQWSIDTADIIGLTIPHLILTLGFLGASIGMSRNEVIRIDFLRKLYSSGVKKVLEIALNGATAALLCIFLYTAYLSNAYDDTFWIAFVYIPVLILLMVKTILLVLTGLFGQPAGDKISGL